MPSTLLFSLAVGLELVAAAWLMAAEPVLAVGGFAGAHTLAAALAGLGVAAKSAGFAGARRASALAAGWVLFVPLLGVIGLALGVAFGHRLTRQPARRDWVAIAIPPLPSRPVQMSERPTYSQGGVIAALRHAKQSEPRVHAVMAAAQLPDRAAVPVLRMALKDLADDVRLYAYAVLDRKESIINARIQRLRSAIDRGDDDARVRARLAEQYWELAYLGLAQGEVARHVRNEAERCARASLAARESPGMRLLLARIALQVGDFETADNHLERAMAAGVDGAEVAPFRAEVAYLRRDFRRVRSELAQLAPLRRADSGMTDILEYWLGAQ